MALTVWEREPEVLWRGSGSRRVLNVADATDPCIVEGTGALIWDLLADVHEEAELVTTLAGAFDVDAAIVRDQVRQFLGELCAIGAVRPR